MPSQPVWFTDDVSNEWRPGYIESADDVPDMSNRRVRQNIHDIKPRHTIITQQKNWQTVPTSHSNSHLDQESPSRPAVLTPNAEPEISDPPSTEMPRQHHQSMEP